MKIFAYVCRFSFLLGFMVGFDALGQAVVVNFPASELCGGIDLGSLSFKPRHWIRSKKLYSESVAVYGYDTNSLDQMLTRKISDFRQSIGWFYCVPKSLSIDGKTHRICSVTGVWVGDGELSCQDDYLRGVNDTVKSFQTMLRMQFYTPRNPTVDSQGCRMWMSKFIDANQHTCYVRFLLRRFNGSSYSCRNSEGYQDYEKEIKTEFLVTIWDADCTSDDIRKDIEESYASIKNEAMTNLTGDALYNNVKDCVAVLTDLNGGKATGILARGNGQVYLYTNWHIAQDGFNTNADPFQSATTITGDNIQLGRLQIPLFKGKCCAV